MQRALPARGAAGSAITDGLCRGAASPRAQMSSRPFLRMRRDDLPDWEARVREARVAAADARGRSALAALLLADPDALEEARALLEAALPEQEGRAAATTLIRLGTALQYLGRHGEALGRFDDAESLVRRERLPGLIDFVLQHRGKCLAELGRVDEARACFRRALRARRIRGDAALVASTEAALAALDAAG